MSQAGIRPRLIVIWVILVALVAAIAIMERKAAREEASEAQSIVDDRSLLPVPIEQLGAIELAYGGALHRFERDANGQWFYHGAHTSTASAHGHVANPETAERIEKAFAGFGRTRMERRFELDAKQDRYGVVSPQIFIMVYRPGELQPLARFAVGDIAPDTVSRYVLVVGTPLVVSIANYQIDNLLQLVDAVNVSTS